MSNILKKDIQDIQIPYNKEKITIFLVTVITSMIVHFQLYSLMITGPDTLLDSMYHQADVWEIMLLRFGLYFVQLIKGNVVSPVLVTLISSILLGITVVLVTDVLEIKNKYFKYITGIIFAVAPNISATLTFFYCSDAYILGMLLATLAVLIIRKNKNKKWTVPISGILLALAIGMYQTYISVTMVLCVATLIIDILNKVDTKQILKNVGKYIIMLIIGIMVFYVLSHIALLIRGVPASGYSGANEIGLTTLKKLPQLLPQSYQSFINYYFNDKMIPNTIWHTNIMYIIVFAIMALALLHIIIKNKIYEKKINTIFVLILILVAPICFGIIEIIVPDVNIHILMACSNIYIIPIFLKILELQLKSDLSNTLKYIVVISTIVIIWNYTWQDNASYIAMKAMQNQAIQTSERIVQKIEDIEEYNPEMKVVFLGGLSNNKYLNKTNTTLEAKRIYERTWGFISGTPTMWWGNMESWKKAIYEYIGVNINLAIDSERDKIYETEEYKNMKNYPEKDSIKVINDIIVVKLSD